MSLVHVFFFLFLVKKIGFFTRDKVLFGVLYKRSYIKMHFYIMKNEIETMKNLFQRRRSITDYNSY